jgi:hypothetical protein
VRQTRGFASAILIIAATCAWPLPARAIPVDLELTLCVDASSSVSFDEFFLQTRGLAEAFRSRPVIEAIRAVGGIAVTLMQFSSADRQRTAVDWTHVPDAVAAAALAEAIERGPRYVTAGTTAIGSVISQASEGFRNNGFEGARLAIDVSGDGRSNEGLLTPFARDRAAAAGITINGLAILNEEPNLDRYYLENVIGGAGAFVSSAADYQDFAAAILAKLLREIGGLPLAQASQNLE